MDLGTYGLTDIFIEGPLGRAHRRPSIFDRRVWVPLCEEEHAIDNLQTLETIIMSYLFREGMVLCFATRRWAFFGNDDEINSKNIKMQMTVNGVSHEEWQNQEREYGNRNQSASGDGSDGQQSFPRTVAKSRPKIWKFAWKCMREQK